MQKQLHLAFFLPSLAGGGAERIVTTLANALVERGHHVDLLLASKQGPLESAVDSRVSLRDFGQKHTAYTIPALVRLLRRRQPDVVVTALLHATVAATGALRWIQHWDQHAPSLCATVHSLPTVLSANAAGLRARILMRIARPVLQNIDTIVGVSHTVARDLSHFASLSPSDIRVIPNPIDVGAIQTAAKAPCPHKWLQEDPPVIVAAGRLSPEKQYPTLLRALAHLHTKRLTRALILGKGPERDSLVALRDELHLRSHVSFLGFLENPYPAFSRADLVVIPSPAEAFGNVVVESLACGTPVVAMDDSGGPVEILENLNANYSPLSSSSPSALADAIDAALEAQINTDALQHRAWDFEVSSIVDRYISLLNRIAHST